MFHESRQVLAAHECELMIYWSVVTSEEKQQFTLIEVIAR